MRTAHVEILDPLQDHRIVTRPHHQLSLKPVTSCEVTAHFVGRQQVEHLHRGIASRQARLCLVGADFALTRDFDARLAEAARDVFKCL